MEKKAMNFTIDERHWHKTVFRPMESRLDSRNAGELKAEFLLLAQPEINSLVVDLSHVEQVDSSGLSALLLGQRAMRLFDGELRLAGPNESVRKLLELTQLDRMFPIYNTVEEAVESRRRFFLDPDDPLHTTEYSEPDMLDEGEEELEYLNRIGSRTTDSEEENRSGTTNFTTTFDHSEPLGPDAPSAQDIRLGAIAAGGSFGAVALTKIMMTPETALELEDFSLMNSPLALGDEEDDVDDLDEEDFDDEDEDLDEEDDAEGEDDEFDEDEDTEEVEDLDEDFEDDDWDEEELEEDEEEDY